ncbi:hypothetical protein M885DRAFT_621924 [Pelagophyceae sp. CCMP2097]|nr:hypothetical protein M885DRAFT_621924 [Pelagophyceae sp. CCMP2097]
MRVPGGASGDTGEALTAALGNALAKRRRDSAPAAVKAGATGLERDVVQSILRAIDAPPTSPSKSPAALHYVKAIYLVLPWGAVQIFAPHQGNAPHRGEPQTLLLSPDLQIPVDALVCVLTPSRDLYEPLVKRP